VTRELRFVGPGETAAALREALSGHGPAILASALAGSTGSAGVRVPQRVAVVVETSGSSGRPKRVALSRDALLASAAASESFLGGPGQWLLALPTHYIAGINVLVRSFASSTEPVTVASGSFTAEAFLGAVGRFEHPVRFTSLVPAQLARLLDDTDAARALATFARVLVGGQSLAPALRERAALAGVRVTTTYGSSETSGGCVYDGVAVGQTEVRIATVDAAEIWLTGPTLAEGYLDDDFEFDPDRTASAFSTDDDGRRWYRTGDTGVLAPDGRLRVTGRLDDVIISGGEKVSLAAIERIVRAVDGFGDAVVIAAPSERWGQVPVVFVAQHPAAQHPAAQHPTAPAARLPELRATVTAALGRAAAPDRIVLVGVMPTLASGKPDRVQLATLTAG
jgi:o-succinylbenzoate---CoA ligase